jgi:uncharacterized membrane protein
MEKLLALLTFLLIAADLNAASYTFQTLSAPGAIATIPEGINDRGDIVGTAEYDDFTSKAFLLVKDEYSFFEVPFGADTVPFGINNAQTIVGSYNCCGAQQGFVRERARRRTLVYSEFDLPFVDVWLTRPNAVNNRGWIVGEYLDNPSSQNGGIQQHGFVTVDDESTSIHVPNSCCTAATGINDSGQIVGYYMDNTDSIVRGFLTHAGDEFDVLVLPGATWTSPLGINRKGQVVGIAIDTLGNLSSWIYDGVTFNPIAVPDAIQTVVLGINRSAWITGYYVDTAGNIYGFIGKPTRR